MYERTYGSEYNSSLSTTDIAKLIRQKIAEAKKAGEIDKGFKFSVRSDYFAGGSAIRLNITAVPVGVKVFNPVWFEMAAQNNLIHNPDKVSRYSEEIDRVRKMVHDFAQAFNHDGSESMIDYFDVNFYCHSCDLHWSEFKDQEEEAIAEAKVKLGQEIN